MKLNAEKATLVAFNIFVGLAACLLIFLKSHYSADGYLSPDSTSYLKLAESILQGNGLMVTNSGRRQAELAHFAIWPMGYSSMIAGLAALLGTSTFIASKVLNCALLLASMAIVARAFGSNGLILSATLVFGGVLEIFSYTWSEVPFTFFLIVLAAVAAKVLSDREGNAWALSALMACASCLLFLSRYIGAFSIGIIGLLALYKFWRRDLAYALKLSLFAIVSALVVVAYLSYNEAQVGYTSGMPRIPAPESAAELFQQVSMSTIQEFIFPLAEWKPQSWKSNVIVVAQAVLLIALVVSLMRTKRQTINLERVRVPFAFILVGGSYLGAIVLMRWNFHFDSLGFRFMAPGFVPILLGLFSLVLDSWPQARKQVAAFVFAMAGMSLMVHAYVAIAGAGPQNYAESTSERIERYRDIPEGSIVIFGDKHLNYLRPELHLAYPRYRPNFAKDENWDEFINSLDPSARIFVDISSHALRKNRYDETVRNFVGQHRPGDLFELDAHSE